MRRVAVFVLAVLTAWVPLGRAGQPEVPHPLAYWVRAAVLVEGPGAWSITVRNGGYYTGYAAWLDGEFNGELSPTRREELVRLLSQLPREALEYSFGAPVIDGPSLTLLYQQPGPTTSYWLGLLTDAERGDARLRSVAAVAEVLLRLVPPGRVQPAVPWRDHASEEPRGRTSGCS